MAPIALGSKHQDLLKAYLEVSKSEKPDWASIALKADFATAKYARDQFTIVKKKLLAAPNGEPISLSDPHSTLLQTVVGVLKADTDWEKVRQLANIKTAKYARDQWTIVKNKLGGASTGSAAATPTSSKATPSRKRKKFEDDEAEEEEGRTPTARDETPSKKAKTPKKPKPKETPTWKETQKKAKMKKPKAEVEESEAEADADADADADAELDDNKLARETPGVQAQVDEQIKTEMQEDFDDQFDDADMFRMD